MQITHFRYELALSVRNMLCDILYVKQNQYAWLLPSALRLHTAHIMHLVHLLVVFFFSLRITNMVNRGNISTAFFFCRRPNTKTGTNLYEISLLFVSTHSNRGQQAGYVSRRSPGTLWQFSSSVSSELQLCTDLYGSGV